MSEKKRAPAPKRATPSKPTARRPRKNAVIPKAKAPPAAGAVSKSTFAVVGIGSSAGGLEALEQFFGGVPPASGLAFVVVQHLDPTRNSMLVELLQRTTSMPVAEITDHVAVRPDHVYVIPPNRDLSILHGVLHLIEPAAPRGLRLPIDFFLRSLAADRREHGVGVILSGMGSDGTLGLRAIKEEAGAAFVQSPESAKFEGMPRSSINAGLADVTAPAEELAQEIIAYLKHVPQWVTRPEVDSGASRSSGLDKVLLLLRAQTGHDFSLYKKSTLVRRIERRIGLHHLAGINDYVRYLRDNPQEAGFLFKELLIGVTSFFRDPAVWEQLKDDVIPALLAARPGGGTLRAWVTACSTGEEAYTLAIVFREAVEQMHPNAHWSLQVFATDLDRDAIDKARTGAYPANIAADVTDARLRRFFVDDERGYRVGKDIREMVIFAPHDLVRDPPFTRLDLLTCRNLLIYLEADLQSKLMPLFHYSLNRGGVLVLGSAETVGTATDLFAGLPGKCRIYRRNETALPPGLAEFPAGIARRRLGERQAVITASTPSAEKPNLQALTDALVLRRFSPAAVLATAHGDVIYTSAKTGKYLEPATGKANLNLFAMAREGLAGPLTSAFVRAVHEQCVELKGLRVSGNGGPQTVDVTVQPLTEPAALRGMVLVVFADRAEPPATPAADDARLGHADDMSALALELRQSRDELQATREQMQTSQEELESTNEELQSTNEELQSTNEELTTSKEEMQSMNEELQTVNHDLNAKLGELTLASDDMANLLNSTDIATLFLDEDLEVRRFTTRATSVFNLIPGDAGRPITDLASALDYPALADDAREVLRSLVVREVEVAANDGRWFRVRTMPYRTQDSRILGVVITFTDISAAKAMEATLREAQAVLESRMTDQAAALGAAKTLENVLRKAQSVLEKRVKAHDVDPRRARGDGTAPER